MLIEKVIMEENNRARDFIIAELLACVTFVLNTICVVTGERKYTAGSAIWEPHFGLIYWLKTILAVVGIVYFFRSCKAPVPWYVKFCTLIILLFSVPIINLILTFYPDLIFSGNIMLRGQMHYNVSEADMRYFSARIPTQIAWSIPMLLIANDLIAKLMRGIKGKR